MGWWQITSDMYNGDEVADVLTDALDPVIATVAGIYQREFGRMPFQEELKSAVDFVVYSSMRFKFTKMRDVPGAAVHMLFRYGKRIQNRPTPVCGFADTNWVGRRVRT